MRGKLLVGSTTTLAGVAGAVVAMAVIWIVTGKPDVSMTANGLLAGLVGVTAGCWVVSTIGALIIGAVAGALVVGSVFFFDRVAKIGDPVGAISVHGICGAWGTIAVGLFSVRADSGVKEGLFYGGGVDQLVSQVIGVVAIAAFVLVAAFILFYALKATVGLRVPVDEEMAGLDEAEHGAPGYAVDNVTGTPADYGARVPSRAWSLRGRAVRIARPLTPTLPLALDTPTPFMKGHLVDSRALPCRRPARLAVGSAGSPLVAARAWVHRTSPAYVDDCGATVPPPRDGGR